MRGKPVQPESPGTLRAALNAVRIRLTVDAVTRHGTLAGAAKELGVSSITIYRVLRKHGYRFETQTVKTIKLRPPQ